MTLRDAWQIFKNHAHGLSYRRKVVGDYAFTNRRHQIIRMVSAKGGKVQVYRDGVGRYEVMGGKTK